MLPKPLLCMFTNRHLIRIIVERAVLWYCIVCIYGGALTIIRFKIEKED